MATGKNSSEKSSKRVDTNLAGSHSNSAEIETLHVRLIASGLREQYAKEPLVAVHPSYDFPNCNDVLLHLYLPDHCRKLRVNKDFSKTSRIETDAGDIRVRDIEIEYDNPGGHPEFFAYSLWEVRLRYHIAGNPAQAIRVRYTIGDPETTRGTVTTIEKT